MTERSKGAPGWGGCPDPEQIAALAERKLVGDEAARVEEHVAGCPDCYHLYSETLELRAEDDKEQEKAGFRAVLQSPVLRLAAAVLLATGLAVSFVHFRSARRPANASLVADLARAVGDRRLIEPRLTGGFQHGRLIVLRSGDAPQGLDAQPAAVLAAVAKIREHAEGDTTPEALGALGVTYLVSGDAGAAVKALESAVAQAPENPRLLSDLAAAYLARATKMDEPADLPQALESAEKAIALPDPPVEAWFNRALAIEALHLTDAARKAWQDYLDRDADSGWAAEARQHLEALPPPRQSSIEEDKARVRAALDEGQEAVTRLATSSASLLRNYFEDEILPAWAEAHLVGHPDEKLHREHAALVGEALARATGDALYSETAETLSTASAAASSLDPQGSQALGYRALREAKRLYDLQQSSCSHFRDALRALEAGGSPYAEWARLQVVISCLYPADQEDAIKVLASLETLAEERAYLQLLGRVRHNEGLLSGVGGQLTDALLRYRSALAVFQKTRDRDGEAYMLANLAEALQILGETRAAWTDRRRSLALCRLVRNPVRRHQILNEALLACLDGRLDRSALHFGTAIVEEAHRWSKPLVVNDALIRRANIHHSLGADDLAVTDLAVARSLLAQPADAHLVARQEAEADVVEGEVLIGKAPEAASEHLGEALAYFRAAAPARLPLLHLSLTRAQLAMGLDESVEASLLAGIQAMEGQRPWQGDPALQVSFFDQATPLFQEMARFQVMRRHDPKRALTFVERGRARQILDSMVGHSALPLDAEQLQRQLPEGVALVYHVALDERLFIWAVSREELQFIERPLPAAELSRLVAAYRSAIERRASLAVVHRTAARLHDELVRPIIPFIVAQRALTFIPDSVVESLPFAGLWNRDTGRYLVEDYVLATAASGTTFAEASASLTPPRHRVPRALVVGNPRFDRQVWTGLYSLPGAEAEAAEIAGLYSGSRLLTGREATKTAFLFGVRDSEIIHYAGHAVARASTAGLLLAPERQGGVSGTLYLRELSGRSFPRTRLVVLAACRTGSGVVSRVEGALSLGRPFLEAGVPAVVASLWDVDDAQGSRFFVAFHRAFLEVGDAALALRRAQLGLLGSGEASLAHPASWAVFNCIGGIGLHSLSKGVLS